MAIRGIIGPLCLLLLRTSSGLSQSHLAKYVRRLIYFAELLPELSFETWRARIYARIREGRLDLISDATIQYGFQRYIDYQTEQKRIIKQAIDTATLRFTINRFINLTAVEMGNTKIRAHRAGLWGRGESCRPFHHKLISDMSCDPAYLYWCWDRFHYNSQGYGNRLLLPLLRDQPQLLKSLTICDSGGPRNPFALPRLNPSPFDFTPILFHLRSLCVWVNCEDTDPTATNASTRYGQSSSFAVKYVIDCALNLEELKLGCVTSITDCFPFYGTTAGPDVFADLKVAHLPKLHSLSLEGLYTTEASLIRLLRSQSSLKHLSLRRIVEGICGRRRLNC